jgi:DNA-binding CsgD family transcriptional regulator
VPGRLVGGGDALLIDESTIGSSAVGLHLTPRESEVLALILRGLENKEIAAELLIVEQSVKHYVSVLLRKFAVPNRAALALAAVRLQLSGTPNFDPIWVPQLLRDTHLLFTVLSGPELRLVAVSEPVSRLFDRPIIGRTLHEALSQFEGTGMLEEIERVYATGEPIVGHAKHIPFDLRGGSPVYRDYIMQALRDEGGAINGVVYFGIDVSDQVVAGDSA